MDSLVVKSHYTRRSGFFIKAIRVVIGEGEKATDGRHEQRARFPVLRRLYIIY